MTMRKHYLDIVGKWAIIFAYDINASDLEDISEWLKALGCDNEIIYEACDVLMKPNSGFTFSNPDIRMSVMCIGNATDDEQWWDTLIHEIRHAEKHISAYYDVDSESEEASYLIGYIARLVIRAMKSD